MSMETLAAKIDGFGLYGVPSSRWLQNSFLKSVSGSCESPGPCGNLPICRVSLRFAGSTICGTNWRIIRHTWYRYIINRTNHEYLHMQVNRELLSLTEAEANLEKIIGGMALSGIGAGIGELTALAVTSELAPTRKRGKYVAILVFTILPFTPSVLWGQLIAAHAGWRYCGALCGAWAAAGFIMTLLFYFPPPRVNSEGLTGRQILSQIDYVGGLLSISGMILFMAGKYMFYILSSFLSLQNLSKAYNGEAIR